MLRRILSNFLSYRRYRGGLWYLVKIYEPEYKGVAWKNQEPKDSEIAVLVECYQIKDYNELTEMNDNLNKKNSNLN